MSDSPKCTDSLVNMVWYLDTCLFMDFIDRNVRTAFDNATASDGRTVLRMEGLKAGSHTFVPAVSGGLRFAFELTKTLSWLRAVQTSLGVSYRYSGLTKAEILRSLRKTHSGRSTEEILAWWQAFTWLLGDYQAVELATGVDEELTTLALSFPIRKNVQDYLHLITAKKLDLAFVTSDKFDNQLDELRAQYYRHIYFWPEIKNLLPLDRDFWRLQ